jgi:Ricin-type beta-trefoil lectin domain/Glycosyl hydrolases family 16
MPGIKRAVRLCKRATRWRLRGALALAVTTPVIALTAVMAPSAAALVAPAAQAASAAVAAAVPAPPAGWSTVFSDDFNGPAGSGADSQWMYDTGPGSNFGDGQIETMTNSTSNVHLDGNGDLDITAFGSGSSWTSGHIQTRASVSAPAGGELEVTASIEQPTGGPGYWPAFWMARPWPNNGEIDIMEDVNSLPEVSANVHCGPDPGGPCHEPDGIGSGLVACSVCLTGYNTYTMILNRTNTSDESITFYVDGTSYFTVTESQVGQWAWQAAFDQNMSIILDLAMGGAYPNGDCACATPNSATTSSGTMSVAYVAAYSTTGGSSGNGGGGGGSGSARGAITGYDGLCVAVRSSYSPVQVHTCNGSSAQRWTVVYADATLQALGKCMGIVGGGTADATPVDLYPCNGTGAQVWLPQSNGELYNPQSGKCLDDTDAGGSRTPLDIWDCVDSADQQWTLP